MQILDSACMEYFVMVALGWFGSSLKTVQTDLLNVTSSGSTECTSDVPVSLQISRRYKAFKALACGVSS